MRRGTVAFVWSIAVATTCLPACTERERGAQPAPASSTAGAVASSRPPASRATTAPAAEPPAPAPPPRAGVAPAAPATALPVDSWVWKAYRGDHFTALFPGEPRVSTLAAEEDRLGYTEAHLDVPGGQVSFAVGFSDYSASQVEHAETFLDAHANAPRRGLTDVLHERPITLPGGHPGRVLILRRNISGTPLRIYSRLHLVGRRLYSLIVSTLDAGGVGEDVVKKFMESFKPS